MGHRINILIEDENWEIFQSMPEDERGRLMNILLHDWALMQKRKLAFKEIELIRKTMDILPGSAEEWIRRNRDWA